MNSFLSPAKNFPRITEVTKKGRMGLRRKGILMATGRLSKLAFCVTLTCAFSSCSSYITDYRKLSFDSAQRGFEAIEKTPHLYEVIELKNVKVIIVGDRKHFNYEKAAAYGSPIAGYANTKNEICLFGKRVGGKVIVNQAILGHEFNHLLNFSNPKIVNPDKLDEMGL